jgi:hypothetical protein
VKYYTCKLADEAAVDLRFARIATLIQQHGADPATAVIADFFPDDHCVCFCLLVTPTGRVFTFDYDWLGRSEAEGELVGWTDITDAQERWIYAEPIAAAVQLATENAG